MMEQATGHLFIGDSITHRMQIFAGQPDFIRDEKPYPLAVDGEPITERDNRIGILARVKSMTTEELKGKIIVLSMGSNQPDKIAEIETAILDLKSKGVDSQNIRLIKLSLASSIFVEPNRLLKIIATKYNVATFSFIPSTIPGDWMHPGNTLEFNKQVFNQPFYTA
jgi:hypothetical protein